MALHTRRQLLGAAAAVAAASAGCSGLVGDGSGSSRSVSEGGRDADFADTSERNPETARFRTDGDEPPVRFPDGDRPDSELGRRGHIESDVIDTAARAGELETAASVDDERLEAFISETSFDAETLYLQSLRVEECFRLELCRIGWSSDEVQTDYGRSLRAYDERCEAEVRRFESWLVRIPEALERESVSSYGTSVGGGGCEAAPGDPEGTEGAAREGGAR